MTIKNKVTKQKMVFLVSKNYESRAKEFLRKHYPNGEAKTNNDMIKSLLNCVGVKMKKQAYYLSTITSNDEIWVGEMTAKKKIIYILKKAA
ncbi:MAG: hypothetical protein EBR02_02320 [Alphaproteobacteria bacterium]|nr:hypothetical protein [Alphaproteobacteria bacterium]